MVLEGDGTELDDDPELFQELKGTTVMLLEQGQQWLPLLQVVYEQTANNVTSSPVDNVKVNSLEIPKDVNMDDSVLVSPILKKRTYPIGNNCFLASVYLYSCHG